MFKVFSWTDSSQIEEGVSIFEEFQHAFYLNDNNDVRQVVYNDFFAADKEYFIPNDNELYLFCLETSNGVDIGFGWSNDVDYNGNEAINGLSASPINVVQTGAATWFLDGWAGVSAPGMSFGLQDTSALGVTSLDAPRVGVYPNPMNDEVKINSSNKSAATVSVTDLSGKVCFGN